MSDLLVSFLYCVLNIHWSGVPTALFGCYMAGAIFWLLHGWCPMKLLPFFGVLCCFSVVAVLHTSCHVLSVQQPAVYEPGQLWPHHLLSAAAVSSCRHRCCLSGNIYCKAVLELHRFYAECLFFIFFIFKDKKEEEGKNEITVWMVISK